MHSLNCKGRLLEWQDPIVMGIINITPDSFYAGSRMQSEENLLRQTEKMMSEGATILDIGGLSSRPGAEEISVDAEMQRVIPAIEFIVNRFPAMLLSVDSYRYKVAEAALQAGACIINDIGVGNEELGELAASYRAPYICMHSRGNPRTMSQLTGYDDLVTEVLDFFIERKASLNRMGVHDLIMDPGFGFAKTIPQNFLLLKKLRLLKIPEIPILVGLSRKASVYKTLDITAHDSLNGSTVLHTLALENGADILRVHDVKEAVEVIRLWTSYAGA